MHIKKKIYKKNLGITPPKFLFFYDTDLKVKIYALLKLSPKTS